MIFKFGNIFLYLILFNIKYKNLHLLLSTFICIPFKLNIKIKYIIKFKIYIF